LTRRRIRRNVRAPPSYGPSKGTCRLTGPNNPEAPAERDSPCTAIVFRACAGGSPSRPPLRCPLAAADEDQGRRHSIRANITYLRPTHRRGRRTFTPGYEKAADWAAAKFKEWAWKPPARTTSLPEGPRSRASGRLTPATGVPSLVVNGRAFYVREKQLHRGPSSRAGVKVEGAGRVRRVPASRRRPRARRVPAWT